MTDRSGLAQLFQPASIAVVGASDDPVKVGHELMASLAPFGGPVFPINRRADTIAHTIGGRRAFASLADVGRPIDLAVLGVPPEAVPAVIEECGAAGVAAAVICAGGFAETGDDGRRGLQEQVRTAATTHGVRILGPNTAGFVNRLDGINASFMPAAESLPVGPLTVVAQSSGVNFVLSFLAASEGLGLRLGVGLGNAVDVGVPDVLEFLVDDDATEVVALHLEGVGDGRELFDAVQRLARVKPVVALKIGRSDVGAFASSHTGSMVGSFELTRSALAQAGAVIVEDPSELIGAARALVATRVPPRADPGVALVTGQAGPGLIITDELRSRGVTLPALSDDTRARLSQLLPPITFQENPVDTGRPEVTFPEVLAAVAADPAIDVLACFAFEERGVIDLPAALRDVAGSGVPLLFGTGGPQEPVVARRGELAASGIAAFDAPERLARAVRAVVEESRARHRLASARDAAAGRHRGSIHLPLDEDQAKSLLEGIGLTACERRVCTGTDAAVAAFHELGAPVVAKILDAAVTHKTDVGGVKVGLRDESMLRAALAGFSASGLSVDRVLIEREADPGPDLIVGAVRDPAFGPTVMIGLGGIWAEVLGARAMRLAPLTDLDCLALVHALPPELLAGFRGSAAVDVAALAHVVASLGALLVDHPEVTSVEINPLRILPDGAVALDAVVE